ncbi:MAG TPA: acetylornithine transaminase [Pseudomonadales bacterium]|nr:acetylornithine transaminase [Pseudomonadales bacterium]
MAVSALMETYRRLPVAFERGEGAWLVDTEGRRYLDALSGIAVCGLGHAHPRIAEALARQASTLIHTSNLYEVPLQTCLAGRLCGLADMDRAFFGNSGAEANEAAIKLARLYGHKRDIEVPTIVVMDGAFHGRTMATLTATGNRKVQAGFEPLVAGFVRAPYGDLDAVRAIGRNQDNVVAVLVEPIQGEGGIRMPGADYLPGLRELCDEHDWLLMLDEVQTGAGRTGKLFAYQHSGIVPDVVTIAKGLANGVPIGACLARGAAAEVLSPGTHGSTFGGNPLAAAAALAALDVIEEDRLLDRATVLGQRIRDGLVAALAGDNRITEVRGLGLMIGIELADPAPDLVADALAAGLLINVTQDRVVRLLPPLILTDAEADRIVEMLAELLLRR